MEESVYLARWVNEVYTGKSGKAQIPVDVYTDSLPLIDSVNSTEQIESRLFQPIMKFMKQLMDARMVDNMIRCDTCVCLADILTESGALLVDEV